jgi:hypothetical protein
MRPTAPLLLALVTVADLLPRLGARARQPSAGLGAGEDCVVDGIVLRGVSAETFTTAGNDFFSAKEYGPALACYQRAVAEQPRHARATLNIGLVLLMRQDYDAAQVPPPRPQHTHIHTPTHRQPTAVPCGDDMGP